MRKHFVFYGNVQGMGFRFICMKLALELGIKGYVKNLSTGDVEAQFQADSNRIDMLINRLKQVHHIDITHIDAVEIPELQDDNFSIRY